MKPSRYLFQLNHPAHFHLYKGTIDSLIKSGNKVLVTARNKEMLEQLIKNYRYVTISNRYRARNLISIILDYYSRDYKLYKVVKTFKPRIMIGTSPEIGHIGKLLDIPSIFLGEDDVDMSYAMYLGALTCYPFFNTILSPEGVNNGIWNSKTITYKSYQKMAYLHPNVFTPDVNRLSINSAKPLFLIRLTNHNAYHDYNNSGINNNILENLVDYLGTKGSVIISSERTIPSKFNDHIYRDPVENFHHYLSFSDLVISDGQSVIVEASILGIPNIRFNNFSNKISILNELETKYSLTTSLDSGNPELLYKKVEEMINNKVKKHYLIRRKKLLNEKVDFSKYLFDFVVNFRKEQI